MHRTFVLASMLGHSACTTSRVAEEPHTPATVVVETEGQGREGARPENEHIFLYGDMTIVVRADASLEGEVDRLFEVFKTMRDESFVIRDGGELPIGWTTLRFGVEGKRISVFEPDYDGDPERDVREDISVSLMTLARQRAVLSIVGVQGQAIDFDRHVLLVRGALEQPDVFLLRVESPGGRMTGWRLSPSAGMQPQDEVDSIPVHEVFAARPELVDAMLLPPGYMAFFEGERMVTLVDPSDVVVWDWARDGELSESTPRAAPSGIGEAGLGDPDLLPGLAPPPS